MISDQFRRYLQVRFGGGLQAKIHVLVMVKRLRKEPLFYWAGGSWVCEMAASGQKQPLSSLAAQPLLSQPLADVEFTQFLQQSKLANSQSQLTEYLTR